MPEAAARLRAVAGLAPAAIESMRLELRGLMASRSMSQHLRVVRQILDGIWAKPSVRAKMRFQSSWADYLPLAVRCRWTGHSEFLK